MSTSRLREWELSAVYHQIIGLGRVEDFKNGRKLVDMAGQFYPYWSGMIALLVPQTLFSDVWKSWLLAALQDLASLPFCPLCKAAGGDKQSKVAAIDPTFGGHCPPQILGSIMSSMGCWVLFRTLNQCCLVVLSNDRTHISVSTDIWYLAGFWLLFPYRTIS